MTMSVAPGDSEAQHAAAGSRFTNLTAPLEYALSYAALGWAVFPCAPRQKVPLTAHGVKDATTDAKTIRQWWARRPDANPAIACGRASGIFVIDIDPRNGGDTTWDALCAANGGKPLCALEALTPGGGTHLVFRYPSQVEVRNCTLGAGIDVISDGKYFLVERSIHPNGRPYAWEASSSPIDGLEASDAPPWLLGMVTGPREQARPNELQVQLRSLARIEIDELRSALAAIPSAEYHRWIEIGMALHSMHVHEGYSLWEEWSATTPQKFSREACLRHWRSFQDRSGAGITKATVFFRAREHGWPPPALDALDMQASVRGRLGIEPDGQTNATKSEPLGVDITEFVADYVPPDGVVDGIVQRGYVHGMTSPTNGGKTAIGTTMGLAVATGQRFAGHEVEQGLVYVLCGENPFDFKGRLIAAMQELGIDPTAAKGRIRVVGQAFPLTAQIERLKSEIRAWGNVVLVFVDTSVAYFSGEDEDSNVEARAHAQTLREFTLLPSRPAVVVACHPVKNATRDNLVPRGGSAFLNEIDTNLTVWAEDEVATLHWHRKIRGTPFEPVQFRLVRKVVEGAKNSKGNPGTAGVAVPIAERDAETLAKRNWHDENRLLDAMLRHPKESIAGWALACAWTVGADGKPHKSKVVRLLEKLQPDKLVKRYRGRWVLTASRKKEAEKDA